MTPRSREDHQRHAFKELNDAASKSAHIVCGPPSDATGVDPVPVEDVSTTADTPTLTNTVTVATTETSIALPTDTRQFLIRARGPSDLRIAFSSGDTVTGPYMEVPKDSSFEQKDVKTSITLYFQTDKADIVEVLAWS